MVRRQHVRLLQANALETTAMIKRFCKFMELEPMDWQQFIDDGGTTWLLFWAGWIALVYFGFRIF